MLTPEQRALAALLKKRIARASKNCIAADGTITQDTGYFVARELVAVAELHALILGAAGAEFLARVGTEATRAALRVKA